MGRFTRMLSVTKNPKGAVPSADLVRDIVVKHPELANVVAAWPRLPDNIRRAILTLVENANRVQGP